MPNTFDRRAPGGLSQRLPNDTAGNGCGTTYAAFFYVSAGYLYVPAIWLSMALHSPSSEALDPDVDDIRIARCARVLS
jgi:hypothetical protein